MNHQPFSAQGNSAALEKEALSRFRQLMTILPSRCDVCREVSGCSTVLILDFLGCPEDLLSVKQQSIMVLLVADRLGLAQSILFRLGEKVAGWANLPVADA